LREPVIGGVPAHFFLEVAKGRGVVDDEKFRAGDLGVNANSK